MSSYGVRPGVRRADGCPPRRVGGAARRGAARDRPARRGGRHGRGLGGAAALGRVRLLRGRRAGGTVAAVRSGPVARSDRAARTGPGPPRGGPAATRRAGVGVRPHRRGPAGATGAPAPRAGPAGRRPAAWQRRARTSVAPCGRTRARAGTRACRNPHRRPRGCAQLPGASVVGSVTRAGSLSSSCASRAARAANHSFTVHGAPLASRYTGDPRAIPACLLTVRSAAPSGVAVRGSRGSTWAGPRGVQGILVGFVARLEPHR